MEAEDGVMVYLSNVTTQYQIIDSCEIKDNKFFFEGDSIVTDRYFIRSKVFYGIDITLEPGSNFDISIEDSNNFSLKVLNGKEEELLNNYQNYSMFELDKIDDLREREEKRIEYILNNPQGIAAIIATDQTLILKYKEIEEIFSVIDTVNYTHTSIYKSIVDKRKELNRKWMVGKTAPGFSALDTRGKEHNLSDYRGKYILLDFWASWCAPCRVKGKIISENLDKLKEHGIEVISYSLDDNKHAWLNASNEDGIRWLNISELTGLDKNTVAENYKVTNLPTMFFINPDGVIISQNPALEEIIAGNLSPESDMLF